MKWAGLHVGMLVHSRGSLVHIHSPTFKHYCSSALSRVHIVLSSEFSTVIKGPMCTMSFVLGIYHADTTAAVGKA